MNSKMPEKVTVPPNVQSILLKPSCLVSRGHHKQTHRQLLTQTHKCDRHNVKITWGINKRMIRSLLSLDLDGTILKHDQTVSKPVIEALKQLQNDYRLDIMINTGRPIYDAIKVMESNNLLSLTRLNSFASGALIAHNLKYWYRYWAIDSAVVDALALDEVLYPIYWDCSVIKTSYLGLPEKEAIEKVSGIQSLFGSKLNIDMTPMANRNDCKWDNSTWAIDITSHGINKGSAIREVASLGQIQKENIIAVGDAHNDIPAYQEAQLPINIGDEFDSYIMPSNQIMLEKTVEEDGFLEAIESYIIPFLEKRKV